MDVSKDALNNSGVCMAFLLLPALKGVFEL